MAVDEVSIMAQYDVPNQRLMRVYRFFGVDNANQILLNL